MSSMVYCRGCGKEIHETAKSCPHCGATNASSGSGEKSRIAAALLGVRLENGNFPTLSVLSLTSDFVPLSANP